MNTCKESGCEGKAVAHGLCSRHYQRQRRGSTREKPGPPQRYERRGDTTYRGAPTLGVRLDPDLLAWVRSQGGANWVRHTMAELRKLSVERGFARYWQQLKATTADTAELPEQEVKDRG